jgi:hypothetical protein
LRIELVRDAGQHRPVHAVLGVGAEHADRRIVGEHGAEQRQRNADAADDDVFPAGLEGGLLVVERDEQDRGQRGALGGDPHDAEVVGQRHQQHHGDKQRREHIVAAQLRSVMRPVAQVAAEIADGVDRAGQRDERRQPDDQRAEGVGPEEAAQRRDRPCASTSAPRFSASSGSPAKASRFNRSHACGAREGRIRRRDRHDLR